jgi:signal transduction histidine kinase
MLHLFQEGVLGDLTLEMDNAIATMISSNQNLLLMVNTLLEVYRYEAGRKTLTFAAVNLVDLVQEVMDELHPLADAKGLNLTVEHQTQNNHTSDIVVIGDRLELRRVITNLLGNAIKFTDLGSVTMRLFLTTSSGIMTHHQSPSMVVLQVEDTGSGIPAEDQPTLFEGFRQGSHNRAGSGLGLHLSRQIVEAHWGKIEVRSELGKGSLFTVELPAPV